MFWPPAGSALVRFVGRGSSFDVALVTRQGRECIAKRPTGQVDDQAGRGAIERESAALFALAGAAVPQLLEAGDDEVGPYVIETLVRGVALREFLVESVVTLGSSVRMPIARRILTLAQQLHDARGADAAPLEVIHADLGPDAFLVLKSGALAAIDFGSAGVRAPTGYLEPTGRGTLPYVAPELCRADSPPSAATDRYAAVLLAAEVLLGRRFARAASDAAQLLEIGDRGHDLDALLTTSPLPERINVALREHLRFEPGARPTRLDDLAAAIAAESPAGGTP